MKNLTTIISWTLNDYCKAQCRYCPTHLRGGGLPREIHEYLRVAQTLIDSYSVQHGRNIEWIFDGGEPLDMDDIARLLKLCKTDGSKMTLHTNGGKLWMDWWAIEPYVDNLVLTYHFWQNPSLMKYIVDTFKEKGKTITINSPIRHNHVNEDLNNVLSLEEKINTPITKTLLYFNADISAGMLDYSLEDLERIDFYNRPKTPINSAEGVNNKYSVEEKIYFQETTWDERYKETYSKHESFTGKMCNAGIERLYIGSLGWASGSQCNNMSMGNIWHPGWVPSIAPQQCGMISCINEDDRRITKIN